MASLELEFTGFYGAVVFMSQTIGSLPLNPFLFLTLRWAHSLILSGFSYESFAVWASYSCIHLISRIQIKCTLIVFEFSCTDTAQQRFKQRGFSDFWSGVRAKLTIPENTVADPSLYDVKPTEPASSPDYFFTRARSSKTLPVIITWVRLNPSHNHDETGFRSLYIWLVIYWFMLFGEISYIFYTG